MMAEPENRQLTKKSDPYDGVKDKKQARRLGFYFVAFITAIVWGLFSLKSTVDGSFENAAGAGISAYTGLILLFPRNKNQWATRSGMIAATACLLSGFWPAAIGLGGLLAFVVHSLTGGAYRGSVLAAVIGGLFLNSTVVSVIDIPVWYYGMLFVLVLSGFFLANKDKKRQMLKKSSETNETDQIQQLWPDFSQNKQVYQEIFDALESIKSQLPVQLIDSVGNIQQKGQLILQCMQEDPRDILAGKRFLDRYLPIAQSATQQLVKVRKRQYEEKPLTDIEEKMLQTLPNLSNAFTQMHQELLKNDVDDLRIDLKVLDKLLKSEGFD